MPSTTTVQETGEVDSEGFFKKLEDWTEEIAADIAREHGIGELTDRHWTVIRYMRERYLDTGSAPTMRTLSKESGVSIKELYQLFPEGPAKLATKIGGIPKPRGCI